MNNTNKIRLLAKADLFGAGDRGRTGTSITAHGILSPGRLPVPPHRQIGLNLCTCILYHTFFDLSNAFFQFLAFFMYFFEIFIFIFNLFTHYALFD